METLIDTESAIFKANVYNEKFLATLQKIRPHLLVSDLDLHFNNLLVSNVDFHSFRNKANIWAKEYFQTIGECDIPMNMIRQSSQALRQSKSVPVFIHRHMQPLWHNLTPIRKNFFLVVFRPEFWLAKIAILNASSRY